MQSHKKLSLENILQPRYVAIALLAACLHTFGPVLPFQIGPDPRIAAAAEPVLPDVPQSLDVNDLLNLPEAPPSVGLDDEGYPQGAGRGYTPAQENPLLGKSVILTPMECAKKYGIQFCACTKLDDGRDACYHQTPSAGYYDLATCEMIWGGGQCQCDEAGSCFYPANSAKPKACPALTRFSFSPVKVWNAVKPG
jgi:hypothetical protein